MKTIKTAMKSFMAVLLLCGLPVSGWAAIIVSFEPLSPTVDVGDNFMVDLMADIPDPVLGWGLDVDFDSTILALVGAPVIGPAWSPALAADGDGLAGLAFPFGVAGNDILLATLTFNALAAGSSGLSAGFTPGDLTEGFALAFPAPPGSFADVTFISGTVNSASITSVPEPASILLMLSGLIGLAGIRKAHKTRGSAG